MSIELQMSAQATLPRSTHVAWRIACLLQGPPAQPGVSNDQALHHAAKLADAAAWMAANGRLATRSTLGSGAPRLAVLAGRRRPAELVRSAQVCDRADRCA